MSNNIESGKKITKLLSIDGGGVRGILAVKKLAEIEKRLNNNRGISGSIGDYFDLVVGTSTGGLIALSLAIGRSAAEAAEFFEQNMPVIFGQESRNSFTWFKNKYESNNLRKCLVSWFGEYELADISNRGGVDVCITSVALNNLTPRLHKSPYNSAYESGKTRKLVDVALATSAAPTFFNPHNMPDSGLLVDGGLFANNPSMVAVVEAINSGTDLKDIVLLSIGTGRSHCTSYDKSLMNKGKIKWAKPVIELTLAAQAIACEKQIEFILDPEKYCRINSDLPGLIELDDYEAICNQKNLQNISQSEGAWCENNL